MIGGYASVLNVSPGAGRIGHDGDRRSGSADGAAVWDTSRCEPLDRLLVTDNVEVISLRVSGRRRIAAALDNLPQQVVRYGLVGEGPNTSSSR